MQTFVDNQWSLNTIKYKNIRSGKFPLHSASSDVHVDLLSLPRRYDTLIINYFDTE